MRVVEYAVPALLGARLVLWPGPGRTELTLERTAMGRPGWTRVEGAGPPAVHLSWAGAGGAIYDTWALLDEAPVLDPEGRFALRLARPGTPPEPGVATLVLDPTGLVQAQDPAVPATPDLPLELDLGGVPVRVLGALPVGSRKVFEPQEGPGAPMAVLAVERAEGRSSTRLLLDEPESRFNTDGVGILLEAGYALATPEAALQVEVARAGATVASGALGPGAPLRWDGGALVFGGLGEAEGGGPEARLVAFHRPAPLPLAVGMALLALAPLAPILRRRR